MAGNERFAFKKLEVYRVALDYYGWALGVSSRLARTDLPLADQFRRQAQSMVHNTAEGAGLWKPGNKRKHYAIGARLTRLCQRYDTSAKEKGSPRAAAGLTSEGRNPR